jgi:ATP synthase protein I
LTDDRRIDGDELDRRIATAKQAELARSGGATRAQARAEGRGWAIGIEFIGAVLVSGAIGWGLDHYVFHSAPWAMIVLLVLGFAAGTRRALTTSQQFDDTARNDRQG